jgi:hypothetical protein
MSVGGAHGDRPPGTMDALLGYVRELRTPTIHDAVKHAKPLGEVARFGFPASQWRHFERLGALPRGLLPIADAICRFNPIYGQGMSVAAQEACVLRHLLGTPAMKRDGLAALAPASLAEIQPVIEAPWAMAAIPDLVFPETTGQRPPDFESALEFGSALTRLAAEDPAVHKLTAEVAHLMKPHTAFRDPELVRRVRAMMAGG